MFNPSRKKRTADVANYEKQVDEKRRSANPLFNQPIESMPGNKTLHP
ncbi:hypothetical protein [Paraburkholderia phenoliruptrix]|nr:hypothetical protein [Paraburkholderia phenoliruptrix]WMY12610.1 hypothetical protein P3F88_24875 [Paraburkholderia phenoliruptrix]